MPRDHPVIRQPSGGSFEINVNDAEIRALYAAFHRRWNARDAAAIAELFADDGNLVGFDGSQVDGRPAIASHLGEIFAHHQTAAYIGIVRDVRFPTTDSALLLAVAGMVPPGQDDINPAVNTVQSLLASRHDGGWRIDLLQSTPAASHGRPEASEALTEELRQAMRKI